mgnify:CR=1 FL=1
MKHKKHLLGIMMIGTILAVTVLSGCESGKQRLEKQRRFQQDNLVTLKEARKQAENFESEYKKSGLFGNTDKNPGCAAGL